MKKLLILLTVLLSSVIFSQTANWTNVKETNISVGIDDKVDIFTNKDGNHIIVLSGGTLKYYKMNLNGVAGSPITIDYPAVSPSITGDADNIYIVYGIGKQVRVKYSTNGGNSWSLWSSFGINTDASFMESVFSNNNLHVTYLESGVVKYRYRSSSGGLWYGPHTVSTGETGTFPRIAAWHTSSQDRVLFLYRKNDTESKWREWNAATNNWVNNPQTAFTVSANQSSIPKGFAVDANYIYSYYEYTDYYPSYAIYSQDQQRSRSNNALIYTSIPRTELFVPNIFSTTTANNISHIAFYFNGRLESGYDIGIIRNKHTGSGITFDQAYQYNYNISDQPTMINISSASNDVYLIWKDGLSNYLKFIYDDQAPLAPKNLSVTKNASAHPVLNWNKNNEADLKEYIIDRAEWGVWSYDIARTTNNSYVDNKVDINPMFLDEISYKIRAVDKTENISTSSNTVTITNAVLHKENLISKNSFDYELSSAYPNPFNPSTKLTYSIKEEGLVTLKVYDVLGKEIAVLVNENKPAGVYEVSFNASNLPSGMYIYKLQSGNFTDVKKMLLTK